LVNFINMPTICGKSSTTLQTTTNSEAWVSPRL
jgi:hypothetical protein